MRNVLLAVALSFSAAAFAQVSETIEVRVTNVDVVVTDRAGNPVQGLTAADFEVIEAGKPQEVTNFYEVRGTPVAQPALAGQPVATPEPAVPPARRRFVVFVDNTTVHPHARKEMLTLLEQSLDRLMNAGDQAMLAFYDGNGTQVLTPLTADRSVLVGKLREAASKSGGSMSMEAQKGTILDNAQMLLDSSEKDRDKAQAYKGPETGGGGSGSGPGGLTRVKNALTVPEAYSMARSAATSYVDQVARNQRNLINQLGQTIDIVSTAEGKKVLVFIGGELSDNPGAEILQRIDNMYAPYHNALQAMHRDGSRSLRADLDGLGQRASAAGVTMYLIDASDKRSISASQGRDSAQTEALTANDTGITMTQVAAATGGVSMPGGKQFQTALDTIVRDLTSYYSVGYRSQSKGAGRIQVRVKNRPELRVRTRQSFNAPATQLASAPSVPAPAAAAAVPPAPAAAGDVPEMTDDLVRTRLLASVHDNDVRGDFPISVAASTPQAQGNGRSQTDLTITFPSTMTLVEEEGELKGRVAVYLVTSNAEGRTSKVSTDVKELKFPLGTRTQIEAQKTFTFTVPLLIGKGPINVSVAVADQLAGTSGFAKTTVVAE